MCIRIGRKLPLLSEASLWGVLRLPRVARTAADAPEFLQKRGCGRGPPCARGSGSESTGVCAGAVGAGGEGTEASCEW